MNKMKLKNNLLFAFAVRNSCLSTKENNFFFYFFSFVGGCLSSSNRQNNARGIPSNLLP